MYFLPSLVLFGWPILFSLVSFGLWLFCQSDTVIYDSWLTYFTYLLIPHFYVAVKSDGRRRRRLWVASGSFTCVVSAEGRSFGVSSPFQSSANVDRRETAACTRGDGGQSRDHENAQNADSGTDKQLQCPGRVLAQCRSHHHVPACRCHSHEWSLQQYYYFY